MYGLGLYSKWELKINSWDVHTLALLWKVIAVGCQRFCEWGLLGVGERERNKHIWFWYSIYNGCLLCLDFTILGFVIYRELPVTHQPQPVILGLSR